VSIYRRCAIGASQAESGTIDTSGGEAAQEQRIVENWPDRHSCGLLDFGSGWISHDTLGMSSRLRRSAPTVVSAGLNLQLLHDRLCADMILAEGMFVEGDGEVRHPATHPDAPSATPIDEVALGLVDVFAIWFPHVRKIPRFEDTLQFGPTILRAIEFNPTTNNPGAPPNLPPASGGSLKEMFT
jgi:hypothetical protein